MAEPAVVEPHAPPRPAPFPHRYAVTLARKGEGASLEAGTRPSILGGAPAEFLGRDDWWSPEHLLLASLSLCLKTTFEAIAAKQGLQVAHYASRTEGTLDKTREGLRFTAIVVEVDLAVAEADLDRAGRLLETAQHYCIVSNALKTPVEVRASVAATA